VALLVLGGAGIGALMMSPESVGLRAFLAIASIYPIMAGLFGEDLVSLALGFGGKKQQTSEPRVATVHKVHKTAVVGQHTSSARHHWFGHGAGPKAA
jgi:hypothetical protein